jgi:hypothetical protein
VSVIVGGDRTGRRKYQGRHGLRDFPSESFARAGGRGSQAPSGPTDGRNVAPREGLTFILFSCRRFVIINALNHTKVPSNTGK